MLDIKKVYVDTRYKTDDSNSDSDFTIELPRTLNVPDNCICYLTDVVIPVSWSTIDSRNNKLYLYLVKYLTPTSWFKHDSIITIPMGNYSGPDFCTALKIAINAQISDGIVLDVVYNKNDNMVTIVRTNLPDWEVLIVSGADLQAGKNWNEEMRKASISSMNGILRIGKESYSLTAATPYTAYLDLHTTRNLYIVSSSLANYNVISNFGNDTIVKKISVKANYSQMLFDTADAGYDFMDVSKRTLSRIDIKLIDSFGNVIDLRNNHWSFSLVFQQR